MTIANETGLVADQPTTGPAQILALGIGDDKDRAGSEPAAGNRLVQFVCELRRRRVCRAATIYSVGFWLVCQVVDVVAPALDLPAWTLKLIVLLGLILFPVALLLSWLIDITPQGLVADVGDSNAVPSTRKVTPLSLVLDCALLATATVIGVLLSTNLLIGNTVEAGDVPRRVAVQPFQVLAGPEPDAFSAGLVVELQHALNGTPGVIVVDAARSGSTKGTLSLNGVVVLKRDTVQITATLFDESSGEVTWSDSISAPRGQAEVGATKLAGYIVAALPLSRLGQDTGTSDEGS